MSAARFYEPIINKLIATLNKIARARLTHVNAAEVIARKIITALCYPCPAVRLNKAQIAALRTKIFAAAAPRPCQTLDAHALFNEKSHVFDPQCAMVYHNLRFWRNVLTKQTEVLPLFLDIWDFSIPLNQTLYGPITILQKDLSWLEVQFNPREGIITHEELGNMSVYEPNKGKFDHYIRELIRRKLALQLLQKHAKWQGILQADVDRSTKFRRGLPCDSPLKVPMLRLLANAHATPYRLYRMGILPTPFCKFCFQEQADICHIVWSCPRFSTLRESWPAELRNRACWPSCALHAMIVTRDMPVNQQEAWPTYQRLVAELLFQWMELNRHADLYQSILPDCALEPDAPMPQLNVHSLGNNKQKSYMEQAQPLLLQWIPPKTRTDINRWGATIDDFCLVFNFWTKITTTRVPQAVPITTWTHALAAFIQIGGKIAPFLQICQNVAMACYKFKVLSTQLIHEKCLEHDTFFHEMQNHQRSRWLPFLPLEAAFPEGLFLACSWDLTSAAAKIHELHTAIRINKNCSANAIRITTADFIDAIPELYKCLTNRPLDSQWHVPRASVKRRNAPWMDLVLDLRRSPFQLPNSFSCITELPLETWQDMSLQDMKSKLPGAPGPKKRFVAAKKGILRFQSAMHTVQRLQFLGAAKRPHIVAPAWQNNDKCFCCQKLLHCSVEPRNLSRDCSNTHDVPSSLFLEWEQKFQNMLDSIEHIISKF